jgi:hypothetical protein
MTTSEDDQRGGRKGGIRGSVGEEHALVTARSNHAACQSFFTVRRNGSSAAVRLTELELMRTLLTHARSSGIIGGRSTASRSPCARGVA